MFIDGYGSEAPDGRLIAGGLMGEPRTPHQEVNQGLLDRNSAVKGWDNWRAEEFAHTTGVSEQTPEEVDAALKNSGHAVWRSILAIEPDETVLITQRPGYGAGGVVRTVEGIESATFQAVVKYPGRVAQWAARLLGRAEPMATVYHTKTRTVPLVVPRIPRQRTSED